MAAPTIEAGTFLFFALFPFLTFVFIPKLSSWGVPGILSFITFGIFGMIMLTGLALIMQGGYVVQVTQNIDSYSSTVSTPSYVVKQNTISGLTITNSTTTYPAITTTTSIPAQAQHVIWINSNQNLFGYLFIGLDLFLALVWLYIMITLGYTVLKSGMKSLKLQGGGR